MDSDTPAPQCPARRKHSAAFKTQILQACSEPGASVAGIAVAHGLNPNMMQRWRREARRGELVLSGVSAFVPVLATPAPTAARRQEGGPDAPPVIEVRLRRAALQAQVRWPAQASGDCATFLRELFR